MRQVREINEDSLKDKFQREAEQLYSKYRDYMDTLESKSILSRFKPITAFEYHALGKMLESVDETIKMNEADGTVSDLGLIPRIARDVVTISYGTSPLPLIASVQPQDEELGVVYYKAVQAITGQGNITAGSIIAGAQGQWITPQGFSSTAMTDALGTGNGTLTTFSGTLPALPVRPGTVVVTAGTVTGQDYNLDGNIIGQGIVSGSTINYDTGAITITFTTAPASGTVVQVQYWALPSGINSTLNQINYELVAMPIRAQIYALKGVTGLFKGWAMQKRFGIAAEEELAVDLVNAINSELVGDLVVQMNNAVPTGSQLSWNITPSSGESYFEHKQSYKDALAGVERMIIETAHRGQISFIIGGTGACSVMRTLFGWETIYEGHGMATAHLFGKLDGVPVIRVTDTNILAPNVAICGYKGPSAFEAPAVYAPYMPLTVTNVLPTPNPLLTQRAAAVWGAVQVLVGNFLGSLSITGTYPYGNPT